MSDKTPAVDTKTVASAGTPEALTTRDVSCSAVIITAETTNTGVMYIVDRTTTTKKYPVDGLVAGASVTLNVQSPKEIFIDTDTSGDGVGWLAS